MPFGRRDGSFGGALIDVDFAAVLILYFSDSESESACLLYVTGSLKSDDVADAVGWPFLAAEEGLTADGRAMVRRRAEMCPRHQTRNTI